MCIAQMVVQQPEMRIAQVQMPGQGQGKRSSVQHQLGSRQHHLQQNPQGLVPSASHTWPNLAPIQAGPSFSVPPPQPQEKVPQPEAELKPPFLRPPAEWSVQQSQVQPQQRPQPQICSPSAATASPVAGCPYPPCQPYCPQGHRRSE
uniref:Uncharacterized protein n=1 Tax=Arundo donax TaxID=35708 RepID=A0A0A9B3R8_ARUDO